MTSTEDYIKIEVTDDADSVPSELHVENTIENPAWYTVEDNHVSLISENVEKVFKLETDMIDDCIWESTIEIAKVVANQNYVELPLECQDVVDNNIELNHETTSEKIFQCNICEESFDFNYLLKKHLAEHKRQENYRTNECEFCGKQFQLKLDLNKHIQKYHVVSYGCRLCSFRTLDTTKYDEHIKVHGINKAKIGTIPNIKLSKLNGIWKSNTNEFKCNICFQKCFSEKKLVEHIETHDNCQTQCGKCLAYVPVSDLIDHNKLEHNQRYYKCKKCNLQFEKLQYLNCHLIHCVNSSHTKLNEVCGKFKTNANTCSACGIVFNKLSSLKNHTIIGCMHYTCKYCGNVFSKKDLWLKHMDLHKEVKRCKMLKLTTDKTSTVRECNETEVVNNYSFNTNGGIFLASSFTERNRLNLRRLVNNEIIVSTAPHTYIPNNNIIQNPEQSEVLSNTLERNNSNQSKLLNSNATIVSTAPHTYIPTNNIIQNLGQSNILSNTLERNNSNQSRLENSNATIVSTAPHTYIPNNNIIQNPEQSEVLLNTLERNNSNQSKLVNSNATIVSTAPHTYIPNNNIIQNPEQSEVLSNTLERNNSDQSKLVNSNATIISTAPHTYIPNNNNVQNLEQSKVLSNTLERNNSNQNKLVNSNATIISTAPHTYIPNNNNVQNLEQSKVLSNTLERNNSNQNKLVNSNATIVSTAPHTYILNNYNVQNLGQSKVLSNTLERNNSNQSRLVNSNATTVSTAPHTYIPNNNNVQNPGQFKVLSNTLERNNSDQSRLVNSNAIVISTASHIFISNNNVKNPRQFKVLSNTLKRNNSNQSRLVNSNTTIVSTAPHTYISNNNIIQNSEQSEVLSDTLERNNSDQSKIVNSNATIVSNAPHIFIPNNNNVQNLGQSNILSNTLERNNSNQSRLENSNATIVSTAPHTYISNNNIIQNSEQSEVLSDTLERNNSDQSKIVNSNATIVSTAPHIFIPNNNNVQNLGQSNILSNTLERNNSNQSRLENRNISIVSMGSQSYISDNLIYNNGEYIESPFNPFYTYDPEASRITNQFYLVKQESSYDEAVRQHFNRRRRLQVYAQSVAYRNSVANNNSRPVINIKQETNSSNQSNLANNNESIVSPASHNSMANNSPVLNIKQERNSSTTLRETNSLDQSNLANSNESIVSPASHNSMTNNCPVLYIKQERNLSTTFRETNISVQSNLANSNESIVSSASHNSMTNNCPVLNIKQEKNYCTNVKEKISSDQMDLANSNESTNQSNGLHDLMAEQNPINIACTFRETPYFYIRKMPNIKKEFCNGNNDDQTSQNSDLFICRICKKSPSTDIHSFALHMSNHSECNMHECIVCDKTFNTVLLWANHMTYHQQQIRLNVSTVQFNSIETESNTLDSINSRNTEPQVCTTSRNQKYDCSTCAKVFPSMITLKTHQTLHNKSKSFSCMYCDRIFSGKGPCTNHEKSHISSGKLLLQNNENNKHETIVSQSNISIEDNNTYSDTLSIEHKKKSKSSLIKKINSCNLCNRKFTKRCYFTNHMILKHNINPNTPKQLTSIDYNELILSGNRELTNEYENKLSISVDNNLNNHINESDGKKSTFCMICNKNFVNLGALTNHMNSHSDCKPYKCQYCYLKFSREGPYRTHEQKHLLKNVISAPSKNKNNITVNEVPPIKHCNDFEFVHNPVDGNSKSKNLMKIKRLWFPCDVCEKKFSTPFQLNVHRKSHDGIVPYVCKICDKSYELKFRWNWHLKGHYKKHNANLKSKQHTSNLKSNISKLNIESICHQDKIKCRYCKKEYNSISQWKKHMTMSKECRRHCKSNIPEFSSNKATKNSSKSGQFKCNICKKTYSTSYNRIMHIKNVHNKKINTTDLNTNDNTGLQKNKSVEKIQQKPAIMKRNRSNHINSTKCELCGKIYSNRANLSRHISMIHTQSYEPMTCNICGSTFKHKFTYRHHLKTKHKRLFKNYEGTNSTNKKTSRKIISANKKYIMKYFCKICEKNFADNITLQEHLKMHTLNLYNCKDCGQKFDTNVSLGNHILENHSSNISTFNINEHVENHESQNASLEIINNNSALCKICFKILKDPRYLQKHMRLHTGVKPFSCHKCNMAFRFESNLRSHLKKHLPCDIP